MHSRFAASYSVRSTRNTHLRTQLQEPEASLHVGRRIHCTMHWSALGAWAGFCDAHEALRGPITRPRTRPSTNALVDLAIIPVFWQFSPAVADASEVVTCCSSTWFERILALRPSPPLQIKWPKILHIRVSNYPDTMHTSAMEACL